MEADDQGPRSAMKTPPNKQWSLTNKKSDLTNISPSEHLDHVYGLNHVAPQIQFDESVKRLGENLNKKAQ